MFLIVSITISYHKCCLLDFTLTDSKLGWHTKILNLGTKHNEPRDLAPVPLKINVMTFSKSHDNKVMTLVFHPTKQIS